MKYNVNQNYELGTHRQAAAEIKTKCNGEEQRQVNYEAEVHDPTHAHQKVRPPLPIKTSAQEIDYKPHVNGNHQ